MNRRYQSGFTIIEVVLFLAISGVMAVGLLVGMGAAISSQQYRDSVQSYADYLRGQYSRVVGVENDRSTDVTCPLGGDTTQRGRSNCVIVGRYVHAQDNGTEYTSQPIYALQSGDTWNYALGDADGNYATNWKASTRLAGQTSGSARVSLVVWRDPDQGYIRASLGDTLITQDDLGAYLTSHQNATLGGADSEICIIDDNVLVGSRQSVFIGNSAGSGDAIRVGSSSEGCSA